MTTIGIILYAAGGVSAEYKHYTVLLLAELLAKG
jgi:hypothetical protein